ncbi:hypothetical protein [Nodularia sp. NIES-3585]|uniref:hypothetical protein n=1 Tax=Nodularia sp. NIES-3585 TaxID=1973477 RepID=UPI000B5CD5D1|nr:hypothetical protein [Nodularia sp. NIES-3585]GAX38430.1 hypothetical protein NIES3585_44790 [Nodularia sp. NIES-3585]
MALKNFLTGSLWSALSVFFIVDAVQAATIYGQAKSLGDGYIRSFVEVSQDGQPLEIGVALNKGALSLPTGNYPVIQTQLDIPSEAGATPFQQIQVDYSPGSAPGFPEVFAVPRFRLDFFLIDSQERALICPNPDTTGPIPLCVGDEALQALKTPVTGAVPDGFFPDGIAEPNYGARFSDPELALPILLGEKQFTDAYGYGYFDGKLTFITAAATKAFVESQATVQTPLKTPVFYPKDGYYPTTYGVSYDATTEEYRIGLGTLVFRSSNAQPVPELSSIWGLLTIAAWGVVFHMRKQQQKTVMSNKIIEDRINS